MARKPWRVRFWERVDMSAGLNECWLWTAASACGYGYINIGNNRAVRANRIACEIARGPAPNESDYALHTCDNRLCVNPRHLYWGSARQNMADKVERHPNCRGWTVVTEEEKQNALARIANGETQRSLAKELNVSPSAVNRWVHGQRRKERVSIV